MREKSAPVDEFFFEERKRDNAIKLTIENEDNFENVVIREEIKRELTSPYFWCIILTSALQNASLLYFYMNFKFMFLKSLDDDWWCTKLATFVEFIGRTAKINSSVIFDTLQLETVFHIIYLTNIAKNVIFIFFGSSFGVFLPLYVVQKVLEGFYYIYNYVYIFKRFENKGSFLMKIFELHKLLSLIFATLIATLLHLYFDFETVIAVLLVGDVIGLVLKHSE